MTVQIPKKCVGVLSQKKRYKVLWGGRGCVHPDTKIDTPKGSVKISEFSGGLVYAFDGENIVEAYACKPIRYTEEQMYRVTFSDGREIVTTDQHRFLTKGSWTETRALCASSTVLSLSSGAFRGQSLTTSDISLSACRQDVRRCLRRLLGWIYHYWQDFRQCDGQPPLEEETFQDVLRRLAGEEGHIFRTSTQTDATAFVNKGDLELLSRHLSTLAVLREEAVQSFEVSESRIDEISSGLLSASFRASQLSRERKTLRAQAQEIAKLLLALCTLSDLDESLRTAFGILLGGVDDTAYSDSFVSCNHSPRYREYVSVLQVEKAERCEYWDMFVPVLNNYFANGVCNHNSAKSHSVARYIVARMAARTTRVLCAREVQNSIKDSVYRLLVDTINLMGMGGFIITHDGIRHKNGSICFFKGLKLNAQDIKSTEGIDICWVEEAERVSEDSWQTLIPTVRKPDSEIIVSFNPDDENGATYRRFVLAPDPERMAIACVNYVDNPWFPDVLRAEMEYDKRVDFEKYEHVWMGKPKRYANAVIFRGKIRIEEFETPTDAQFYFGADWGFSNDPTCLVRSFIKERTLFIDHDAYGVGVELTDLPKLFDSVPLARRYRIRADCARPETISFMSRQGFDIVAADKWSGSVEDGIEFLRSFEQIVIHPRAKGSVKDFQNYRWKTDRITGECLPIPADGADHIPDACLVGGTLVETPSGSKRIEDIVEGDYVLTRKGFKRVYHSCLTRKDADVITIESESGKTIIGTGNHLVFFNGNFGRLDTIRCGDIITETTEDSCKTSRLSNTEGKLTADTQRQRKEPSEHTSGAVASFFTGLFGKKNEAQSRRSTTSTTSTETRGITRSEILSVLLQKNIIKKTAGTSLTRSRKLGANILTESDRSQKNGTDPQKGKNGTETTVTKLGQKEKALKRIVFVAGKSLIRFLQGKTNSVPMHAKANGEERKDLTTLTPYAQDAEKHSRGTNTRSRKEAFAQRRVLRVAEAGKADVYDISVEDEEEFFANGILVHNCRYAFAPLIRKKTSIFDVL